MRPRLWMTVCGAVCAAALFGADTVCAQGAAVENEITLSATKGRVYVRTEEVRQFYPAEKGATYPFGTEFRTGKNGSALVQIGEGNTVRLLESTGAVFQKYEETPRRVSVWLVMGEVKVTLDNKPKKYGFEVATPLGVAIAKSTDFIVAYLLHTDGMSHYMKVACIEGEVVVDGNYVSTPDDTIRAGSILEFGVLACLERDYAFLPLISIQGQDLHITLAKLHKVLFEDGALAKGAMENIPKRTEYFALDVLAGRVLVEETILDKDSPAEFIRGTKIMEGHNADDYMNAAEWLCTQCNELLEAPLDCWYADSWVFGVNPDILMQIEQLPDPVGPKIVPVNPPLNPVPPLHDVPLSPAETEQ
ncbi:MAG: FecR family protein [Candidatus Pacebacteria bacterium]|nr:FecR family protein [Candidatus Paceibacterota bacterium]